MNLEGTIQTYWDSFVACVPDSERVASRFYEAFSIGDTPESADHGASLILSGEKTATSSLLWEYEIGGTPLPSVGDFSILLDGRGGPVCVVETMELEIKPFDEVDARFAHDYGEWGGSLAGWRKGCWAYYEAQGRTLGKKPSREMPLVCERFRVVFTGHRQEDPSCS